ncbi:MAG: dethiobiotin synthase [Helicobacteraceae bacterium]|jgi:dethiobiotin synthetase|nr:dethiobiotin synthase [Helicobacteraceae bacterium]
MAVKAIFITATGTDAGKTFIASSLIAYYSALGLKVAPFKPIETGVLSRPQDAATLQKIALGFDHNPRFALETVCPIRFALAAAPAIAKGEAPIDWKAIDLAFKRLSDESDLILIEGAGGAFAPIDDSFFSIDISARFKAKTLLISRDRLGMIHDLLTTIETIEKRSGVLPLWAINVRNAEDFEKISEPYLARRFGRFNRLDKDFEIIAGMLIR